MSGSTSVAVSGGAGDGYRAPFTPVQWQELEHQALIYKYLVAGVPVPSDLVLPIRRSFEALSARFLHHPTLGYCSYYGKKFDPEPGRCRRTDGKKWRCSKDAYHESKYCERHMHRGRNRSRKPVESQSTSQSSSTTMPHISTGTSGKGSYRNVSCTTSPSQSLYPITNSGSIDFGGNASNSWYTQGLTVTNDQNYISGVSRNVSFGMDSNVDDSWRLMSSQVQTNSLLKPQNDSYSQSNALQLNVTTSYEPMIDPTTISKQRQQHCFLGNEIVQPEQVKHEQHSMLPFFDEWPKPKESWPNFDATTQLSISMDPDLNARNPCPSNDA